MSLPPVVSSQRAAPARLSPLSGRPTSATAGAAELAPAPFDRAPLPHIQPGTDNSTGHEPPAQQQPQPDAPPASAHSPGWSAPRMPASASCGGEERTRQRRHLWRWWLGVLATAVLMTLLYVVVTLMVVTVSVGHMVAPSDVPSGMMAGYVLTGAFIFVATAVVTVLSISWCAMGRAGGRENGNAAPSGPRWALRLQGHLRRPARRDRVTSVVTSTTDLLESGQQRLLPATPDSISAAPSPDHGSPSHTPSSAPVYAASGHGAPHIAAGSSWRTGAAGPLPPGSLPPLALSPEPSGVLDPADGAPPHLLCPLTGQLFQAPVLADDGRTYERAAIQLWLQMGTDSPFGGAPISGASLRPDPALAVEAAAWRTRRITAAARPLPYTDLSVSSTMLGVGSFKTVLAGTYRGRDVAVCVVRDGRSAAAEAAAMRAAGHHPRVLALVGAGSSPDGLHYLVTERVSHGALDGALASLAAHGAPLSPIVTLKLALQVCEGMLALVGAGVVHGDLGARNILLCRPLNPQDHRSVDIKIADFGRSTRAGAGAPYPTGAAGERPVRYMSPEALADDAQNEHTDIWGFGVLLWEVAAMGRIPYAHVPDDGEVAAGVTGGRLRLEPPAGMPKGLHSLMDCCLNFAPEDRPCFAQVKIALLRVAAGMGVVAMCTGQQ